MDHPWIVAALVALALFVVAHFKRSRPDGDLIGRVHPYRRLMPFIMPTRNESVVYFDDYVRAEGLLDYLAEAKAEFGADLTHAVVAALDVVLAVNPRMNRFVAGSRLYQRRGRWFTFAAKRKAKDASAKLGVVKLEMKDGETFRQLVARINERIDVERSDARTGLDQELSLLTLVPRSALALLIAAARYLDHLGLLPAAFIRGDGMYTSVFIANLGSVGMRPGYHHLYEWGTASAFAMVGRIEEAPVVQDGALVVGKVLHMRYSYDERIDDGLTSSYGMRLLNQILADPRRWLGGLESDGTADLPLWPRPDAEDLAYWRDVQ